MIKDIIAIVYLACILIATIKLQIFLSKKDNKALGLIIPAFILITSLVYSVFVTPMYSEMETSTVTVYETGEVLEESLDTIISTDIIDKSTALMSIIYIMSIINSGNIVMLGIYFYCRHNKKMCQYRNTVM
jgi:hypothetical protein